VGDFSKESMLELFVFEMKQQLEQLEQLIIQGEQGYTSEDIGEIFRIMHTIKGSAAMMEYNNISKTAHAVEDLFFYLREENPSDVDYSSLTDIVLEGMDFIKSELEKIEAGEAADADATELIAKIKNYLAVLKGESPDAKKEEPKAVEVPKSEVKVEPLEVVELDVRLTDIRQGLCLRTAVKWKMSVLLHCFIILKM
jgi:two-component system chemotaxis sensor kinase CheA